MKTYAPLAPAGSMIGNFEMIWVRGLKYGQRRYPAQPRSPEHDAQGWSARSGPQAEGEEMERETRLELATFSLEGRDVYAL